MVQLSLTAVVEEDMPSSVASTYFAHEYETGEDTAKEINLTVATAATVDAPVKSTRAAPVVPDVLAGYDHPPKECSEEMELNKCTD